jgi:hypothetical protein
VTSAVLSVRSDPTAEAWLAAIRERSKFGIAIAAMIRMIATTINNSISEKPRGPFFILPSSLIFLVLSYCLPALVQFACHPGLQIVSSLQITTVLSWC